MTRIEIYRRLGITVAGLNVLAIAVDDPHGRATGPTVRTPRLELRRSSLLLEMDFGPDIITPMGRDVVAQARELAWDNLLGGN